MEWRTVLRPRPQAHPGPVSTPRLAALPEPCRKTRLQRKALTHQPGFYSFPTRSVLWGSGKKGKRTYLAALRERPRGPAAGEGAPRSHSPPGRSPHGPSLPPRRRAPPSQLSRKRKELPVRAPGTSSSAKARVSSLCVDAQRIPAARQSRRVAPRPRGGAFRRWAAGPAAGPVLGPGASFSARDPAFPRSRPSCGDGRGALVEDDEAAAAVVRAGAPGREGC